MKRLIRRIKRYFQTRDISLILPASPAVLVIGVWIFFGTFLAGWGTQHTEARYREIAGRASSTRDYETARVAYWRLVNLNGEKRSEYLFGLALNLLGQQKEQEAQGILTQLAPLDKPGYADAHLFLAQRLLLSTNAPPDAARLAELHLLRAVDANPSMTEARLILGQIYARQGKFDLARKHLLEVVGTRGEATLLLAIVMRSQGDETGATQYAQRAAKFFAERLAQAPGDDPGSRIAWANACLMLKDYETALRVLQDGFRQTGNTVYQPNIGTVYALWVQNLTREKPGEIAKRLELIQAGLQTVPQSEILLRELVDITGSKGAQGEEARAVIQRLLAQGGSDTAMLHFFLGMDAWRRGQKEESEQHFNLAFQLASNVPSVANNMAMILTVGETPDYERALSIIQPVIDKYPGNTFFKSTRGQIYLKMRKFKEAAADLEAALPYMPNKRNIRLALADAYRGLGLRELAVQQESLADRGD